MSAKILAVGDVCGEPGLDYLTKNLRRLRKELELDFVVVNGENANVVGITPRQGGRHTARRCGCHNPRQPHMDAHRAASVS